jgi:acyl dehydratase
LQPQPARGTVRTMITVPRELLGREVDLGEVTVTAEMIATYARAVGDDETLAGSLHEAPPTFCLVLRRGMTPEIELPPGMFGVYGGHDMEFHQAIRAGETYRISARITDVFEKSGRTGELTVVVREADIRDQHGQLVTRVVEQQIVRQRRSQDR